MTEFPEFDFLFTKGLEFLTVAPTASDPNVAVNFNPSAFINPGGTATASSAVESTGNTKSTQDPLTSAVLGLIRKPGGSARQHDIVGYRDIIRVDGRFLLSQWGNYCSNGKGIPKSEFTVVAFVTQAR